MPRIVWVTHIGPLEPGIDYGGWPDADRRGAANPHVRKAVARGDSVLCCLACNQVVMVWPNAPTKTAREAVLQEHASWHDSEWKLPPSNTIELPAQLVNRGHLGIYFDVLQAMRSVSAGSRSELDGDITQLEDEQAVRKEGSGLFGTKGGQDD